MKLFKHRCLLVPALCSTALGKQLERSEGLPCGNACFGAYKRSQYKQQSPQTESAQLE